MLIVNIMVTTASKGLETLDTIGIRNTGGDDERANYEITVDGILRANVINFERDRGATALVLEALEAVELKGDRYKTFISRKKHHKENAP